ncbi:elongation factor G [bacterium]|nr:elongation factor G [bacterium]
MRDYSLNQTRNFGIMAHIDAGKTTISERILFYTGKIHKMGETHDGDTVLDWMEEEQERGITITAAATTTYWKNTRFNIIDTPGHVDFTVEVQRSLRVLDGAIAVLDSQAGVEPQTETVWRQASEYKVPRIVFSNKMDKAGADFELSCKSIKDRLGATAKAIQIPIGAEDSFRGIIDIVERRAYEYHNDKQEEPEEIPIPKELVDEVERKRSDLIETVSDFDDELMELYLSGEDIEPSLLKKAIRKATLSATFFPVLCGSAFKNKGILLLLDAIVDYLPAPSDVEMVKATKKDGTEVKLSYEDSAPFAALAFKVMTDPFVGKLVYFRVYSGHLDKGGVVVNTVTGQKERFGRILLMNADEREDIDSVYSGDIAAVVGLKDTTTGQTLCAINNPVLLESMTFPEPVVMIAIEPKTKADQERMANAIQKLTEEDPTFKSYTDKETGQTILAGMGELHLDILVERMKREFKVQANVGNPQVSYRETFTEKGTVRGDFIRQTGGKGQYGDCVIEFEPNPGKGYEFHDKTTGGVIPKEFIVSIDKGLQESMESGVLCGYPMMDIKCSVVDGSYHEVDSSDLAFKIAASMALRNAKDVCKPTLLEPIMAVDVVVPEVYLGSVMSDLTQRRGRIEGQEIRTIDAKISAMVPLANMFGYTTALRSLTQGRGTSTMRFSHYETAAKSVQEEIIRKRNG